MRVILSWGLAVVCFSATVVGAAEPPALSAKELAAARTLYTLKCLKCHEAHDPRKYSAVQWDEWLYRMNRKAKLRPEQADLIKRYTARQRDQPDEK